MTLDVVNSENQKIGTVNLDDAVFGGRVKNDLIWESVVRQNASERRGTHKAKNRALVSGSGRKPYKQKGTGRPQVGSIRTPLWRHGGTVFPPQPRSYDYQLPKKVERGALRAALASKIQSGAVVVVDELRVAQRKTKAAAEWLNKIGRVDGPMLLVDVSLDPMFVGSARNLSGITCVASGKLTARDVTKTARIIATRAAIERLQEVLG